MSYIGRLLIAADVCPTRRFENRFSVADVSCIDDELLREIRRSDIFLANLECPLVDTGSPAHRFGPILGAARKTSIGLKELGVNVVNLANNHILDYGHCGLRSTIDALDSVGINYFGAGLSLSDANRNIAVSLGEYSIGFWGAAASEFSIASRTSGGANPIDLYTIHKSISSAKESVDYLVVTVHTGLEGNPYPSPNMQRLCRMLVELGADAVICQHSHSAAAIESYRGKFVSYGQGDFLFDRPTKTAVDQRRGYLIALDLHDGAKGVTGEPALIPFEQDRLNATVHLLEQTDSQLFLKTISEWSADVQDPDVVEQKWMEVVRSRSSAYYAQLLCSSRWMWRVNRRIPFAQKMFTRLHKRLLLNLVRCEDHREVLMSMLERDAGSDS